MNNKLGRLFFIQIVFLTLVLQTACIPDSEVQNVVITEDVLYISGEKVRLTGRVIEATGAVDDHGFYISTDADFTSPITIALGPKANGLGRFIGEYDRLDINTGYYYRSFANIKGQEVTGQIKEFASLKPSLDIFFPQEGFAGTAIKILGANFTLDTKVFVGDTEVILESLENESVITVRVPPIASSSEVLIRVQVQDTTMLFQRPFAYYFGKWKQETTFFDNRQIYESMFAFDNGQFVFGMGKDAQSVSNTLVWGLDMATYTWSDLNFPGSLPMRSPFSSNGYWGSGVEVRSFGGTVLSPYFWRYAGGVFEQKPFLNFRLYQSVALHLNGDLYVFGGKNADETDNFIIHRYQELLDVWDIAGDAPVVLSNAYPYFAYNNKAYFLLPEGDIWQFNPAEGWTVVANFPGNVEMGGIADVLNDKIYIGLFENSSLVWEWDINNDNWVKKAMFPGSIRDITIAHFAYNNKIYVFRSKFSGGQYEIDPRMELWSLDPQALK